MWELIVIIALAAAGYLAYKHWGQVKAEVKSIENGFGDPPVPPTAVDPNPQPSQPPNPPAA